MDSAKKMDSGIDARLWGFTIRVQGLLNRQLLSKRKNYSRKKKLMMKSNT